MNAHLWSPTGDSASPTLLLDEDWVGALISDALLSDMSFVAALASPETTTNANVPTPHVLQSSDVSYPAPQKAVTDGGDMKTEMVQLQAEASRLWATRVASVGSERNERPNNSWQRRKRDLRQLREEVALLESELDRLKDGTDANQAHNLDRERHFQELEGRLHVTREAQLLQASQRENSRLKALVRQHSALAGALQLALTQIRSGELQTEARVAAQVEQRSLYDVLEQKLDANAPSIAEVMVCTNLGATKLEHHDHVSDGIGSIQRARTLPFDAAMASDSFWRHAQRGFHDVAFTAGPSDVLPSGAVTTDVQVPLTRSDAEDTGRFHFRGVVKRCKTPTDVVVQFACVTEWHTSAVLSPFVTEEMAWTLTRPTSSKSPTAATCLSSSIETTMASLDGHGPRCSRAMRRTLMTSTIMPAVHQMISFMEQIVENALLDSSIETSRGARGDQ